MIDITPDPIAFRVGPVAVAWYGIGYALATIAIVRVAQLEVRRRGIDPRHVVNATLLVAVLALIGGRLYHVVDDFHLYRDNLAAIVLPPYSGLGLYGGIAGGMLGLLIYTRRERLPLLRSMDAVFPGVLLGQAIARWGNFFNQELYGPPTSAPWGIAIDCEHRAGTPYPCSEFPAETTGFHPLFFYESALTFSGFLVATYLNRRHFGRLRDGDIVSFWFIWYGATRTLLEVFRTGYNWTIAGIPTAMLIGVAAMAGGALTIWWRHRRPRPAAPEPVSDETAGSDEPAARAVAETATGTEVEAETRPGRAATPADMEQRA